MSYSFPTRLKHVSKRMSGVNNACGSYIRGGVEVPMDFSPILISPDELNAGGVDSLIRVEHQDFALWRCDRGPDGKLGLGTLYPPRAGDKIRFKDEIYTLVSMGMDDPVYIHTTSNRDRCIVHSVRTEAA